MASSPTPSADSRTRAAALREALATRVVVADGAMGTMLQAQDPTLADFEDLEGCNEILNLTRPDIVRSVHEAYFAVGVDCVETNTFGANTAALGEYDIPERVHELSESGARIAREVADEFTASTGEQRWVLGSMGPGTKLPTLGHVPYATIRDGFQANAEGLIAGGADALIVETTQDLLQTKAAILGARRALDALGSDLPLLCSLAFETTGTMLLGSEIGAALTALEPLGIDMIGLNCSTGPAEMSEHLRYLTRHSRIPLLCMPNAGLPVLTKDGAHFPLDAEGLADAQETFVQEYGLSLVGGCCGTTPEHLRQVVERVRGTAPGARDPRPEPGAASLYQSIPFRQDTAYLAIGERTNANGSKKFREAMLEGRWDDCVEMARDQIREGAHMLDLCVDYVGRDGVADMEELAGRFATASTLPIVLDSTELPVLRAGLEKLGGRAVLNSVNYEDGDGPESRFVKVTQLAAEHGAALIALTIDEEGQARTAEHKVAVAERLIEDLTGNWGIQESDILIDTLTFTICTGQEESRKDGVATIEAIRELKKRHPDVQTTLGLSNISFGLNPAARVVLNSVFLDECVKAGLDSAIVHASKILPIARLEEEQVKVALDLIHDRRAEGYDPLQKLMELFEGVNMKSMKEGKAEELAALPLDERLQRRIIDGEKNGLEEDLAEALNDTPALDIVNNTLLAGMKVVGELFGSGQMQLPFVLQSAEVMKSAVAYLEPHMEKSDAEGKGTIVLATVRGDVHDIGKNLVDIILSNNGFNVVNIGIKQPVSAILEAAEEHKADVIGMSGLLVKSTVIMKENLEELNQRKLAADYPVILGGAALTRAYVEQDLHEIYEGEVRYARDAFEGLRLMDALIAVKRGVPGATLPELKQRRVPKRDTAVLEVNEPEEGVRSDVSVTNPVPAPPFWGSRVVKGIQLKEYASWLDEGALFKGQWGLKQTRAGDGPTYEELAESEGRPRLRGLLDKLQTENLLEAAVVYGYYPCVSKGDDLILLHEDGSERTRFTFPRQRRGRRLCLADFFRPEESGEKDVIGLQVVTVGSRIGTETAKLFEANAYRDYLELHGLSVQLAEALAEYWHARVRSELGFAGEDPADVEDMFALKYRGARFSLGYGACPDLEDRAKIADLLQPERIGVHLSEEFQLHPEQSTDAIVIHHPEAKYFNAR
ncbi:methionine synthase (B12-dependent) [Streptomyces sp. KhCrAH-43]|uniref:methionine synthase n=1 Tax=unclassified Streptomyces TaxID=2593676 RepID=UPI00035D86E0|nr:MULTISPECIES: methionine synthase [unclassified Streptomyces]MYS32740.1 methionine synthase [Streptomyces sp. SID4920]MYX68325.1 methionine synthase [Streptomyces sp. SID8373]RAJ54505.1 methionine synthase (B12-dependent) [Streptomyces sp. KhCrAH-43]